jgi:zinc transporter ZupT
MSNNLLYIILFAAPLIGGLIAVFYKEGKSTNFPVLMGFVGAFLLSIVLVGILPHLYHEEDASIAIFILIGFFLESILELIFGAKHHHHEQDHEHSHDHTHGSLPIGLFIALAIHSFAEGIPLTHRLNGGEDAQTGLIFGIALHEMIAAFSLLLLIRTTGLKKGAIIGFAFLYAIISPSGAIIGSFIDQTHDHVHALPKLMAVAVGTILHVSMDVLSQPLHSKSKQLVKFIAIILGIAAGFLLIH